MSDISNLFVKDSYDYVLQSDIATGIVYRIGGSIPVNPIFSSGATFLQSLKYSNGTEQNGYVLVTDAFGNATWSTPFSGGGIATLNSLTAPSQSFNVGTLGSDFNIISSSSTHTFNIPDASSTSRGLVTTGTQYFSGVKLFNNGLSATTIAAETLFNTSLVVFSSFTYSNGTEQDGYALFTDISGNSEWRASGVITGGTFSGGTLTLNNNSGQTINVSGFEKRFAVNIGDGVNSAITINHGLATRDIQIEVYRNSSPWDTIFCDVQRTTINSVLLEFSSPILADEYRVLIST